MITNEVIFFTGFTVFILAMLIIDLGVFSKKDHVVSFKEAAVWSAIWVVFALIFYGIINYYGHLIHGIDSMEKLREIAAEYSPDVVLTEGNLALSLEAYRSNMALEFITGYLLEYSLSVDNIFVIIMIFSSFGVSEKYYKKVLFWGVLGAIVMRFIFIFLGAALIHHFGIILYAFGLFLLYTGFKMLRSDDEDEKIDPNRHPVVKFASRNFSVYPRFVRENFFIRKQGKLYVTPLFLVVMIVEFTDLIFAVDSVPAVFAVTSDPYIVFFSNIFAILGLRSMFFFLANIVHIFHYLKTGLAFLLMFIGIKMLAHEWLHAIGFKTQYSLYVILGILATSVIASLLFPPKNKESETVSPAPLPGKNASLKESQEK